MELEAENVKGGEVVADQDAVEEGLRAIARILANEFGNELEKTIGTAIDKAVGNKVSNSVGIPVGTKVPADSLISSEELAGRLGLKVGAVRRHEREGVIPSVRIGKRTIRFNLAEVLETLSPGA